MYKDQVRYQAITTDMIPATCLATRKYNGRAVTIEGNTVRQGDTEWKLDSAMPEGLWYAEAYCPSHERPDSVTPRNKKHLAYAIYDCDDKSSLRGIPQFTGGTKWHLPEFKQCRTKDELLRFHQHAIQEKWEGLCLRDNFTTPTSMLKLKNPIHLTAHVVAYTTSHDRVKSVLLALNDQGHYRPIGWVSGMSGDLRSELRTALSEHAVFSSVRLVHDSIQAHIVEPRVLVNVTAHDVSQTRKGKPIETCTLIYGTRRKLAHAQAGKYQRFGEVRLTHLSCWTLASDGVYTPTSLDEWKQHADVSESNDTPYTIRTLSEKNRRVWKKGEGLRGFAVLVASDGGYVFTTVDYSPKRKQAFQTKAFTVKSLGLVVTLVGTWIENNVKRGWEEVPVGKQ